MSNQRDVKGNGCQSKEMSKAMDVKGNECQSKEMSKAMNVKGKRWQRQWMSKAIDVNLECEGGLARKLRFHTFNGWNLKEVWHEMRF